MNCLNCGKEIPSDAKFCRYCGNSLHTEQEDSTDNGAWKIKKNKTEIKPWLRFFARMSDYLLVWLALIIFQLSSLLSDALVIFVWVFVEGIFLSRYGTTPGKWLFNIHVKTEDENILSFNQAIKRSFSVWFRGLAMGIPYASVATLIMSYDYILHNGFAKWDINEKFKVIHGPIDFRKMPIIFLFFIIFIFMQFT